MGKGWGGVVVGEGGGVGHKEIHDQAVVLLCRETSRFRPRGSLAPSHAETLPASGSPCRLRAPTHPPHTHTLQGKAEVVQRALEVQSLPGALPVQLVQPTSGKLSWVLDQESAGALRIDDWAQGSKKFPRSENPPKPADA